MVDSVADQQVVALGGRVGDRRGRAAGKRGHEKEGKRGSGQSVHRRSPVDSKRPGATAPTCVRERRRRTMHPAQRPSTSNSPIPTKLPSAYPSTPVATAGTASRRQPNSTAYAIEIGGPPMQAVAAMTIRSGEHTPELQSLMTSTYAVFR